MTAIVAVLNKHAVSVAADSAATISSSNNQKVFNTANKLFTLSKYHPISVAIYNNSELVGIPWEIIVKEYRKHLGEKAFHSLKEYADDLFRFMHDRHYFVTPENQRLHLFSVMMNFMGEAIFSVRGNNLSITGSALTVGIEQLLDQIIADMNGFDSYPTYDTFDEDSFGNFLKTEIDNVLSSLSSELNVVLKRAKVVNTFYLLFTKKIPLQLLYKKYQHFPSLLTFSGIVFTGFGDSEIFPSLYSYRVQYVIDGKLSVVNESSISINTNDDVFIQPFAQADVMATLIDGIAPVVKEIYFKGLADPIKNLLKDISNQVRPVNRKLSDNIDKFISIDLQRMPGTCPLPSCHLGPELKHPLYQRRKQMEEINAHNNKQKLFSVSFSKESDSLPMWNYYGHDGHGLSIGFDAHQIVNQGYDLVECIYDETLTEALAGYIYDSCYLISEPEPLTIDLDIISKDSHFEYEKECRIPLRQHYGNSCITKRNQFHPIKYDLKGGVISPYVEVFVPLEAIQEIWVGPTNDIDLAVDSLRGWLNSIGMSWVKIMKSSAPLK